MDTNLPGRQKTASSTRRYTIILCSCPVRSTPKVLSTSTTYLMQFNARVPDSLQRRIKDQQFKTRPNIKNILTFSRNGDTNGKWNLTPANATSSASCPTSKKSPDIKLLSPWANTGNNKCACQQVPGHHNQQWPLLVHPYWWCSSRRKPDSGVPAKKFQGVYSKSQVGDRPTP